MQLHLQHHLHQGIRHACGTGWGISSVRLPHSHRQAATQPQAGNVTTYKPRPRCHGRAEKYHIFAGAEKYHILAGPRGYALLQCRLLVGARHRLGHCRPREGLYTCACPRLDPGLCGSGTRQCPSTGSVADRALLQGRIGQAWAGHPHAYSLVLARLQLAPAAHRVRHAYTGGHGRLKV